MNDTKNSGSKVFKWFLLNKIKYKNNSPKLPYTAGKNRILDKGINAKHIPVIQQFCFWRNRMLIDDSSNKKNVLGVVSTLQYKPRVTA